MASVAKDLPPLPPPDDALPHSTSTDSQSPPAPQHQPKHPGGPGLFKRLTTKLRTPSASGSAAMGDPSSGSGGNPRAKRRAQTHNAPAPAMENAWTSPSQRAAALRARGLIPPMRDAEGFKLPMSEQEARLDRDVAVVVPEEGASEPAKEHQKGKSVDRNSEKEREESEAGKIAEAWMRQNMGDGYQPRPRSPTPPPSAQPSTGMYPNVHFSLCYERLSYMSSPRTHEFETATTDPSASVPHARAAGIEAS